MSRCCDGEHCGYCEWVGHHVEPCPERDGPGRRGGTVNDTLTDLGLLRKAMDKIVRLRTENTELQLRIWKLEQRRESST